MTEIDSDQRCMKCGEVMFEKVRLDAEGHMAVNTPTQAELLRTKTISTSSVRSAERRI